MSTQRRKLSTLQQAALVAVGIFVVALAVARLQTPSNLKASLLANSSSGGSTYVCMYRDSDQKFGFIPFHESQPAGWNPSGGCPMLGAATCWSNSRTGELIYDQYSMGGEWQQVDGGQCGGMNSGSLKQADGTVNEWSQWSNQSGGGSGAGANTAGSGGSGDMDSSSSGGGGGGTDGTVINMCYQNDSTQERQVLDGPSGGSLGGEWRSVGLEQCNGISQGEIKKISELGGSGDTSGTSSGSGDTGSTSSTGSGSETGTTSDSDGDTSGTTNGTTSTSTSTGTTTNTNTSTSSSGSGEGQSPVTRTLPTRQHTWFFKGGQTATSAILDLNDSNFIDFLQKIEAKCRQISKNNLKWMPNSGVNHRDNWKAFGMPDCGAADRDQTGDQNLRPVAGQEPRCWLRNDDMEVVLDHDRGPNWREVEREKCEGLQVGQVRGHDREGDDRDMDRDREDRDREDRDRDDRDRDRDRDMGIDRDQDGRPVEVDNIEFEHRKQDVQRELRDRNREVRDMEREVKRSGKGDADLQAKVDAFKQALRAFEQCLTSASDNESMNQCDDLRETVDGSGIRDRLNALQSKQEINQLLKARGDLYHMERDLKRMEDNGLDVSAVRKLFETVKRLTLEIKQMLDGGADAETIREKMDEMREIRGDFHYEMNAFYDKEREQEGQKRRGELEREFTKACGNFGREIKRVEKDLKRSGRENEVATVTGKIQALQQKCEQLKRDVLSQTGEDGTFDDRDAWDAMGDLWQEFEEIMKSVWEQQSCQDAGRRLEEIKRILNEELPHIIERAREKSADIATQMEALLSQARDHIGKAEAVFNQGECEEVFHRLDQMEDTIRPQFEALMEQVGIDDDDDFRPPRLIDHRDDYGDVYEHIFEFEEEIDRDFSRDDFVKELDGRDYGTRDVALVKRIAAEVVKEYFKAGRPKGGDLIKYGAEVGIDTTGVQRLIEAKNDLLKELEQLKTEVANLRQEARAIVAQIEEYNFGVATAAKAKAFVKNELSQLSKAEAEKRLTALKEEAREEKFDLGVIPFVDTDDDQWYTAFAARVKQRGWIKGTGASGGTKMDPGGITNVAEAVTMFGRLHGVDSGAQPTSRLGQRLPEWARAAAGSLEQKGVDMDSIFGGKVAGDSVSRGEVARLIKQTLRLPTADPGAADSFADIGQANSAEREAIAAVKSAGIMTGEGDGSTFNVKGPLVRAALGKTLDVAAQKSDVPLLNQSSR